jgi:hypothetical protein
MRRSVKDRDERADKMLDKAGKYMVSIAQGNRGQADLLAKVEFVVNDGIDIFPAHGLVSGMSSFLDGKSWTRRSIFVLVRDRKESVDLVDPLRHCVGVANRRSWELWMKYIA